MNNKRKTNSNKRKSLIKRWIKFTRLMTKTCWLEYQIQHWSRSNKSIKTAWTSSRISMTEVLLRMLPTRMWVQPPLTTSKIKPFMITCSQNYNLNRTRFSLSEKDSRMKSTISIIRSKRKQKLRKNKRKWERRFLLSLISCKRRKKWLTILQHSRTSSMNSTKI